MSDQLDRIRALLESSLVENFGTVEVEKEEDDNKKLYCIMQVTMQFDVTLLRDEEIAALVDVMKADLKALHIKMEELKDNLSKE